MRKSTKLAILVLALVALCSVSAFAAVKGTWTWDAAANEWTFVDSDGYLVSSEWAKDTNGKYYYLGDDGFMLRDQLVEYEGNYYYVGADGAKVVNAWVQVPVEEDSDEDFDEEFRWYYFDKSGKAYKDDKKKVEGVEYIFDENGKMCFGYVSEDKTIVNTDDPFDAAVVYYCGTNDDGAVKKTYWAKIANIDDKGAYEDEKDHWVFFKSNGKKATDADDDAFGVKYEGKRYYFDSEGRMLYNWKSIGTPDKKNAYLGDEDEGWMYKKTWIYTDKRPDGTDATDKEDKWFYVDNAGEAQSAGLVAKINTKFYAFNEYAEMLSGIVELDSNVIEVGTTKVVGEADTDVTLNDWVSDPGKNYFFFSNDYKNDGSLKKSNTFEVEFKDDTYKLTTDKTGKLITGLSSKKYYINGYLLAAEEDYKYQVIEVVTDEAGTKKEFKLLGTSGQAVADKKSVVDADGNYYVVLDSKIYKVPEHLDKRSSIASKIKADTWKITIDKVEYTIVPTYDTAKGYYTISLTK